MKYRAYTDSGGEGRDEGDCYFFGGVLERRKGFFFLEDWDWDWVECVDLVDWPKCVLCVSVAMNDDESLQQQDLRLCGKK